MTNDEIDKEVNEWYESHQDVIEKLNKQHPVTESTEEVTVRSILKLIDRLKSHAEQTKGDAYENE
jgi:hypothetical protein